MSALGCFRLLPLLRCQHAAARYAGHSRTLGSFPWLPLVRHFSAVTQLQTRNTAQLEVFRSPLRIQSLSRFSTANSNAQEKDKGYPVTTKYKKVKPAENQFEFLNDPNIPFIKKFSEAFKKYWYVMLPVHLITSGIYFLCFYYLASIGFSPIPLLDKLGLFEGLLESAKKSNFAIIAVALVFQKIASPVRVLTTLYIVRALARRGKLLTSSEALRVVKKYLNR